MMSHTPAHGQEGAVAADQMEVAAHEHHGASKITKHLHGLNKLIFSLVVFSLIFA